MKRLDDHTFHRIGRLMYSTVGLHFADHKKALVASRLANRIDRLGLDGFDAYAELLEDDSDPVEFQVAVDLLTTNETYFFREPRHFEILSDALSQRKQQCRLGQPLALWSAASSFGDEAYSLSMLLSELQERGQIGPQWSILATDISDRVLRSAQTGIYPEERLRFVLPHRLKRYCLKGEGPAQGQVMVRPEVQKRVSFGQLNLTRPFSGIGPFDVVMLRNVLIYFDPPTKVTVVDRVLATLKPGGLFFIGTAEGRVPCKTALTPVAPGVFRKGGE